MILVDLVVKSRSGHLVPCASTYNIDCGQSRVRYGGDDKGRTGSAMKLCDFPYIVHEPMIETGLIKDL